MLTIIILCIYTLSLVKVINRYIDKGVETTFWAFLFLLCPVLNTILAIKLTKKEDFYLFSLSKWKRSFKSFIKELDL
jgi:hypothetical protein